MVAGTNAPQGGLIMGPTVLVVEDDRDLREAVAELLRIEGFEPVCAGNGQEALDYLGAGKRPRLILLDLMMPTMDGEQFRSAQLERPRLQSIPVVILSARTDVPLLARRLRCPYLTKPFEVGALLDTVKRYARRNEERSA
jgi:CheY-like chemotaxis protein